MTQPTRRRGLALPVPGHANRGRGSDVALVWRGGALSYAELSGASDDLARRLVGTGLGPGDRVAALLPNRPLYVTLVHAAARIGATLVPLNTRLTAPELAWQLADARPSVLLADRALLGTLARADATGESTKVVLAPDTDGDSGADGMAARDPDGDSGADAIAARDPEGATYLDDLPSADCELISAVDPNAAQAVIYTSGTSGRPKGAILTHGALSWNAAASALRLGVAANDRWLVPLTLFHVGGLAAVLRSAWYGTVVSLPATFEASAIARQLQAGDVTLASLVPTMLARVLDAWGDEPPPAALRAILLGGGPVSRELLDRCIARELPISLTYGLTEAASQVATAPPTREPRLDAGLPPLPFTELRIFDEDRQQLQRGAVGEIAVRSPSVTAGYWNDPRFAKTISSSGWLFTGDGGYLDENGNLHVAGRRADLIVTGGENVYPAEVEAVLDLHRAVEESCVLGVSDPEWGSRVVAVVVLLTGAETSAPELEAFARDRLAGYKVPREVIWRGHPLPRTAAGKLRRAEVRDELGAGSRDETEL